jgi:hypothetical protein
VGGLQEEIRSAIALHRPSNVQTASALALLQEEELNLCKKRVGYKDTSKSSSHSSGYSDKLAILDKVCRARASPRKLRPMIS